MQELCAEVCDVTDPITNDGTPETTEDTADYSSVHRLYGQHIIQVLSIKTRSYELDDSRSLNLACKQCSQSCIRCQDNCKK